MMLIRVDVRAVIGGTPPRCTIVLMETTNARLRLFRVPEMLAVAFTLGALGLVSTFLF